MSSRDNIDSQELESHTAEVILPEELLLNSLLLFEDELSEEEISGLQDEEESDNPPHPEKTGSSNTPGPLVSAADSNMAINKAVLELEKQDTENHYQKVKKELAHYLKERLNIVEKVRKELLAKSKSGAPKSDFDADNLKPGNKINFDLSKQNKNANSNIILNKKTNNKSGFTKENQNTSLKVNSKEKKLISDDNTTNHQGKSKKIVKSQKVRISKQNAPATVNISILKFQPENPRRIGVFKLNHSSSSKPEYKSRKSINSLNNLEFNNFPEGDLAERNSLERNKIISTKQNITEKYQTNLLNKENQHAIAPRDLQINKISLNSVKNTHMNHFKQSFINKVNLNLEDRSHSGDKENNMSMKDMAWGKKDLEFKQLSLDEDRRNSGYTFKM